MKAQLTLTVLSLVMATTMATAQSEQASLPPELAASSIVEAQAITVVERQPAPPVIAQPPVIQNQQLSVTAKSVKDSYAVGEPIKLNISSNKNAYIYLFSIEPSGQAIQLLPNHKDNYHYVAANTTVTLPRQDLVLPEFVADKAGFEKILVVASPQRLDLNRYLPKTLSHYQMGSSEDLMNGFAQKSIVVADRPTVGNPNTPEIVRTEVMIPITATVTPQPVIVQQPVTVPQPVTVTPTPVANTYTGGNAALNTANGIATLIATRQQTYRNQDWVEVTYGTMGEGILHLAQVHQDGRLEILKKQRVKGNIRQEQVRVSPSVRQFVAWVATTPQDNLNGSSFQTLPSGSAVISIFVNP